MVERAELLTVVVEAAERIVAGVTREPAHLQLVVVCLGQYSERAVPVSYTHLTLPTIYSV